MSNGEPARSFAAYARGCDPSRDSDWRAACHMLVVGDDFSLLLPWAADLKVLIDDGAQTVTLNISDGGVEIASA